MTMRSYWAIVTSILDSGSGGKRSGARSGGVESLHRGDPSPAFTPYIWEDVDGGETAAVTTTIRRDHRDFRDPAPAAPGLPGCPSRGPGMSRPRGRRRCGGHRRAPDTSSAAP